MNARTLLITGASTGIGRACVARAVTAGARVFAQVRKQSDADSLVAEFGVTPVTFDVADDAGVAAGAAQVRQALAGGQLDGLVNNAGIAVPGPLLHLEASELARQMDVNLVGVHRVTKAFAPLMHTGAKSKPGRIVMMSSVGGRQAAPFNGAYNASKFALEGYSAALRKELMLFGIDVIVIGPGAIATPIWDKAEAESFDRFANTPFAPALEKVRRHMLKIGHAGLAPEAVADLVWRALTITAPKPRYAIQRRPFRDGFLMRALPSRMLDRLTARWLGFPTGA